MITTKSTLVGWPPGVWDHSERVSHRRRLSDLRGKPISLNLGLRYRSSGECRLNQVARSAPLGFSIMPGHPVGRSVGLPPNVNVTPAEVSMGGGPRATAGSIALQPIAHRADEVIE